MTSSDAPKARPRRRIRLRTTLASSVLALFTVAATLVAAYLLGLWKALPDLTPQSLRAEQSIILLDRSGRELYRIYTNEDRVPHGDGAVTDRLKNAIIALEDERFHERPCIDIRAIGRAIVANIDDYGSQGGSTITQQLVRSALLTPDKTIRRKLMEIMLACRLEQQISKEEILSLYMDRVAFGPGIYGIVQAARTYFDTDPARLTIAQAAVIASLPQRPSYYSPYGIHVRTTVERDVFRQLRDGSLLEKDLTPEMIMPGLLGQTVTTPTGPVLLPGRADFAIRNMHRLGFIDDAEYSQAAAELIQTAFLPRDRNRFEASHYTLLVRNRVRVLMADRQAEQDWIKQGLRVSTTLDPHYQRVAEDTIARLFPDLSQRFAAHDVALIALDRRTREVLAYVGSPDYYDDVHFGKIDMVQQPRAPGSSFKPFVYATAFQETGLNPSSRIDDFPLTIDGVTPRNYEGRYWGRMTVRNALGASRNLPAIRAYLQAGGEDPVLALAAGAGMPYLLQQRYLRRQSDPDFHYAWPLAIGAAELPLYQLVQGYATLADGGIFRPTVNIRSIVSVEGDIVYIPPAVEPVKAIEPGVAEDIVSILSDPAARPAGWWRQQFNFDPPMTVAVKTGTSNICLRRDLTGACREQLANNVWSMGFNDNLVVGVWVGNADNAPMAPDADGLNVAVPIWRDFLSQTRDMQPLP